MPRLVISAEGLGKLRRLVVSISCMVNHKDVLSESQGVTGEGLRKDALLSYGYIYAYIYMDIWYI